ncbi:MAG: hypothetical protein HN576_08160 [Bacteriovoracaceae bacterium]|nr:hypothetical protein [Bacteriovoracaceae bacterium]
MKRLFGLSKGKMIIVIAITSIVTAFVLSVGLDTKEEGFQKKVVSKKVVSKKVVSKKVVKNVKLVSKKPKKKIAYEGNNIKRIKKEIDSFMKVALTESTSCEKFINDEIQNPDYIDPKSSKFNNANGILQKIDALAHAVVRNNSTQAYHFIEKIIYHKEFYKNKLDVMNIRNYLAKIEVCRDPKLFNFLLSSIEAANDRHWKPAVRSKLHRKISKYFLQDLEKFPSTITLAYSTQYLKGLVLNNFIDESYREEILTLMNEVMDHQMYVINSIAPENNKEDNLMVLQEDFSQRKFFGEKIKSLFLRVDNEMN